MPKSSMATNTPCSRSVSMFLRAWPLSEIRLRSVISSTISDGRMAPRKACTSATSAGQERCSGATFTAMWKSGGVAQPCMSRWISLSRCCVSGTIMFSASAAAMKMSGRTGPTPGRVQRIRASAPSQRPVRLPYTGWYSTWNSSAAIARRSCSLNDCRLACNRYAPSASNAPHSRATGRYAISSCCQARTTASGGAMTLMANSPRPAIDIVDPPICSSPAADQPSLWIGAPLPSVTSSW